MIIGRGNRSARRKNVPQCNFAHHKPHMTWPGLEPGPRGGKPATNRLSYGTAFSCRNYDISLQNTNSLQIRKWHATARLFSWGQRREPWRDRHGCSLLLPGRVSVTAVPSYKAGRRVSGAPNTRRRSRL
jgi:hypothetical protein